MSNRITDLLGALDRGDDDALNRLLPLVYEDLLKTARGQLRRIRPGETLNTTALVHETYLKLARQKRLSARDRGHFLAIVSRAMRQILVDAARSRLTCKRGSGAPPLELSESLCASDGDAEKLLFVDATLGKLRRLDQNLARVVECRFFGGLTEAEAGEVLGVSARTAHRYWLRARAWLRRELSPPTR